MNKSNVTIIIVFVIEKVVHSRNESVKRLKNTRNFKELKVRHSYDIGRYIKMTVTFLFCFVFDFTNLRQQRVGNVCS